MWTSARKQLCAAHQEWTIMDGLQQPLAGASGFWLSSCSAWTRSQNSGLKNPNTWWPEAGQASKEPDLGAVRRRQTDKAFKSLPKKWKRKGMYLQTEKARSKQGTCWGFIVPGRLELPAQVWSRQVPASNHMSHSAQKTSSLSLSVLAASMPAAVRCWRTTARCRKTTQYTAFDFEAESGQIKVFSGGSMLPDTPKLQGSFH